MSDQASLVEVGHEVGLTFPPGARLLGVARERGIDDHLRFKVDISVDQLDRFLASTPILKEAFEPGEGGFLGPPGPDAAFWDSSHATNLRTGQAILKNQRVLNVGFGDAVGTRVALYIVSHGT